MKTMVNYLSANILNDSINDLSEDFFELKYLTESASQNLSYFHIRLIKYQKYIQPKTYVQVTINLNILKNLFGKLITDIIFFQQTLVTKKIDEYLLLKIIAKRNEIFDLIRTNYGFLGSLITSTDWQSPSSDFSLFSKAGVQTGKIINTINDYKRDEHLDEKMYEKLFLKEYIDTKYKNKLRCLLTSSGMSAFTTILNYLVMEGKVKRNVLLGKSSYFQYKQLVVKLFAKKVIEISEMETDKLLRVIFQQKPSVIFFDSLCNAKDISVPDIDRIIDHLVNFYKDEIYLVLDNTGLSISYQPWKKFIVKSKNIHLIVFESLIKYLQFGFDRANGGVIISSFNDANKIFEYRKNLGTNISDYAVYVLPLPNRERLKNKLSRFQRNTDLITQELERVVSENHTIVEKIIYPKLSHHAAFKKATKMSFTGCFFNLLFKEELESVSFYKKYISQTLKLAKKYNFDLTLASSFGLNHTRIYLTSLWTDCGEPFVRISLGCECRWEIEILKEVLCNSIRSKKSLIPKTFLLSLNKYKEKLGLEKF